jgi:hypothetical protein
MKLVDGRDCGACSACCRYLPIKQPELDKPTNQKCPHLTSSVGCKVYSTRPQVCRDWYCGWRMLPQLGEAWRPDKSGILIRVDSTVDRRLELRFLLFKAPAPLSKRWFCDALASLVSLGDVDVYIQVPGPIGYYPRQVLINDFAASSLRSRNLPQFQTQLRAAYNSLMNDSFTPDGILLRTTL